MMFFMLASNAYFVHKVREHWAKAGKGGKVTPGGRRAVHPTGGPREMF